MERSESSRGLGRHETEQVKRYQIFPVDDLKLIHEKLFCVDSLKEMSAGNGILGAVLLDDRAIHKAGGVQGKK